jgi:hypothetical protein
MADRYWVGGGGSWSSTTKWSATSGGASGASVPTATDNAIFDANSGSGNFTVTLGVSQTCLDLRVDGYTSGVITFAGTSQFIVRRDLLLLDGPSNITWTATNLNIITTGSTASIDTNGVPLPYIIFAKAGATYTLASDLTVTGSGSTGLYLYDGTLNTNGHTLTAAHIRGIGRTAELNCASSSIIFNGTGSGTTAYPIFNENTFTFTPGTSTVTVTGALASIGNTAPSINRSIYNFELTDTSNTTFTFTFEQANNLSVSAPSSSGVKQFTFAKSCTINGTLSITGTAGNRRVWLQSSTYGLARTLTINSAPSLTDADFRDIYVIGTAAPISGTRIGDLRGNSNITFSTPKNCFRIGTGNWSDDQWSDTSGGSPNTDFFPLAQDTAVFDESTTAGTHTMNAAIPYTGTVDMSARTTALTLSLGSSQTVFGNWTFGSGITISGAQTLNFNGRNTQVITSAGKTFSGFITVNSLGGTVELADALNIGTQNLNVTNGTFDTKGYSVTAGVLSSSNSNVREIKLGASTVTLSGNVTFTTSTNLTLDAGTSTIVQSAVVPTFNGGNQNFYNVSFTNPVNGGFAIKINQSNTFNNISVTGPSSGSLRILEFYDDQTITGSLTASAVSIIRRIMLRSGVVGTTRTLTVGTLSADNCDFRDITIAGTAAGGSPTRAGDCGGNSGVNFPAPKTVYWNLSGTRNWTNTAWATTSGGTPSLDNYPLAQDTAIIDEAGAVGTISFNAPINLHTIDTSGRITPWNITTFHGPDIYGDVFISTPSPGSFVFRMSGRSTQTITSNGASIFRLNIISPLSNVVLADALTITDSVSSQGLKLDFGSFDANGYNVTTSALNSSSSNARTLKMGSGTWTISGTGSCWNVSSSSNLALYKGTADILLSDTSTTARNFFGGALSYNKLTIGGATGTSTLTISGNNTFTELASTKTVAHTIALGTTTQTFGKWSVTGTSGNVVTLTGTGVSHILAGACTDSIDYLAMGGIGFSVNSPAEFYAGANSTGTAGAPVYRTAKPADSTRYWVGGTGNWNDTNKWSTSSGGAGGADLPRSHDDVVFDSSSNATAYTATVNAITGGNRCKALTVAGPASGNVTLAGSTALLIHDDITLPATGLTRTYTGTITLSGTGAGKTITTNGVNLASSVTVNGVGAEWALGDALNITSGTLSIVRGSFDCDTYNLTCNSISSNNTHSRAIDFGSSTITLSGNTPLTFGTTESARANLTFTAGTSQINMSSTTTTFIGNGQTFYNISFTSTNASTSSILGANTFNDLSVTGPAGAGIANLSISADQTINGTLTLSAGTNATMRTFVRSNIIGTTRTLTCATVASLTDIDFRDITIAGAAVSGGDLTGTRLGDGKGNTGITFGAGADKYWNLAGGGNWSATAWATSSGGSVSNDNFPLAQDTCLFEATGLNSGSTVTINAAYNIGTIDMSARTTNTMTLSNSGTSLVHGNWINGTGVTLSGSGTWTFVGRGSQTITSAGKSFGFLLRVETPGGSVTLQDALELTTANNSIFSLVAGTFDANGYNVTIAGGTDLDAIGSDKVVAVGSGTWTIAGSGIVWDALPSTGLTVTGTGTIKFTSASSKSFLGGNLDYSGITIDQAGAGTLTVLGNNTLANITNSYSATGATTIAFGTTTQRVADFTATGTAGNVLTIQGSSATNPCTLIFTGTGEATTAATDYLTLTGVRAYPLADTWYAGVNSTSNGSLGWSFTATPVVVTSTGNFFMFF